jgi:S-DNA-T family DNA segregation ATPase FtsK/SpoIIIE
VDALAERLHRAGHVAEVLDLPGYRDCLGQLAQSMHVPEPVGGQGTYLLVYGAEVANSLLKQRSATSAGTGLDDFRMLLREGPARGMHIFGWWRGVRRLGEDLGTGGKDDIAGILALNVRGNELGLLIGQPTLHWAPRHNRALLIDRQEDTRRLLMPFVRPGRYAEDES